jgi:glycosyltransferase involved in cell wall biosynthesis
MNRVTKGLMRTIAGGRNVMLATGAGAGDPAPGMKWLFATAIGSAEARSIRPDLRRPPARPLRLIYAGRLSSEKGVEHLVESLGFLREIDPALVSLTIAGDGPCRQRMASRVRELGCEGIVRFAGLLDRSTLLRELMQSDLCVLPSLTESFCKARLDAMLCGVPVLTTEVGFGRAIVGTDGERGWIVPAADANAIAAAIARIAHDPLDWPALRARCHSYVMSLTLEEWTRRIGEICAAQWNMSLREGRLCFR